MAYRRHLADDADLQHSEADDAATRWPVAWLILRPAKYGPVHQLPAEVRACSEGLLRSQKDAPALPPPSHHRSPPPIANPRINT